MGNFFFFRNTLISKKIINIHQLIDHATQKKIILYVDSYVGAKTNMSISIETQERLEISLLHYVLTQELRRLFIKDI